MLESKNNLKVLFETSDETDVWIRLDLQNKSPEMIKKNKKQKQTNKKS